MNFRGRAMHWYALAKTRLSGLDKAKVEKRLKSFEQLAEVPNTIDSLAGFMEKLSACRCISLVDPRQIAQTAPPLPGNSGMAVALQKETGVAVQEIWGHGEPCYLMFQIP